MCKGIRDYDFDLHQITIHINVYGPDIIPGILFVNVHIQSFVY